MPGTRGPRQMLDIIRQGSKTRTVVPIFQMGKLRLREEKVPNEQQSHQEKSETRCRPSFSLFF